MSTELSTFFRKRLGKRLVIDSESAMRVAYTGRDAGDESGMTHTRKRFIQQEHRHKYMARLKLQLLVALKDSGFVDFKLADT